MAQPGTRKPGRKSRVRSLAKAPQGVCRQLTPQEVLVERLALAIDMLRLVAEDALMPEIQEHAEGISVDVYRLWCAARQLP